MDGSTTPIILCVDDDKVTLRAIERSLVNNGYSVLTADSGARALTTLQKTKPNLILLDAVMPIMDGYEVCSHLQANPALATIPIIFVTAQEEEEERAKALSLGAADYLVKPIQRDILLRKVALHISAGTAPSSQNLVPLESISPPTLRLVARQQLQPPPLDQSADTSVLANGKHDPTPEETPEWNASQGQDAEVLLQAHELEHLIKERTREISQTNATLQSVLAEQREVEVALRQSQSDLERRLQERMVELEQSQAARQEAHIARQTLEESLRQAQEQLTQQAQEHTQAIAYANNALEAEREARQQTEATLHQVQEDLERRLHEQTAEVEQLQTSLREEQATRHTFEDSLRQAQEDLERRLREQTAEVEQLQASLRDEQATRHTLEDSLRQAQEDLERRLHEQTAEVEQLQTSLRDEQATRHTLEDSLCQLREGADRFLQDNTTDIEHATKALQTELAERKRAEETLIHTLQEHKQLTEALPDAFFVIDQQGKIRKWNKVIEQASGYTSDELLGLPAIQLFCGRGTRPYHGNPL
jgi:CheY-like chemotaxis protein